MSLASGDLTTLPTAKSYVIPLPSDAVLSGLVVRVSRMIQGALNRPLLVPRAYTEQYDGTGTRQLVLPHYPLISLSSLVVSGVTIPISPQPSSSGSVTVAFGYRFQPWNGLPPGNPAVLELVGTSFISGRQNVVATYTAGYQVSNEAGIIPTPSGPYTLTPLAPYGSWATDQGVTFASTGTALTPQPVGSTLATGQYIPPDPTLATPRLTYTFAAADNGKGVLLNYGFIPADVEQVALELIAERASYRNRVQIRSQSLAGQESLAYGGDEGLSKWAIEALLPYMSVLPPAIGAAI